MTVHELFYDLFDQIVVHDPDWLPRNVLAANYSAIFSEHEFQRMFGGEKGTQWVKRLNEGLASFGNDRTKIDRMLAILMCLPFAYQTDEEPLQRISLNREDSVKDICYNTGVYQHYLSAAISMFVNYRTKDNSCHIFFSAGLSALILPSGILALILPGQHLSFMSHLALLGIVKAMNGTVAISENCLRKDLDDMNQAQIVAVQNLRHLQRSNGMEETR